MELDAPKGADHSGYQQIIRPSLEMRAGLKSLSASEPVVGKHGSKRPTNVRLRLAGMWTGGRAPGKCGPIPMFPADSHVDSHLVATIDVRGRPLGPDRDRDDIHLKGEASRFRWLRAPATMKNEGLAGAPSPTTLGAVRTTPHSGIRLRASPPNRRYGGTAATSATVRSPRMASPYLLRRVSKVHSGGCLR